MKCAKGKYPGRYSVIIPPPLPKEEQSEPAQSEPVSVPTPPPGKMEALTVAPPQRRKP